MSKSNLSHLVQLGLAVTIMSSSGTLGRYINLPPATIIWIRCIIGVFALFAVIQIMNLNIRIKDKRSGIYLLLGGILLGGHWVTYFYALRLSSVAVGMLALFTYPVISAILEPLVLKTRFDPWTIILALISLAGLFFLVPELSFDNQYTLGITIGVISAIFYSFRNILIKKQIGGQSGITIMFYQLLVVSVLGWPMLWIESTSWSAVSGNWQGLLVLGLLTTATGHTLFTFSFRHFSVSTVSILSALTPLIGTFYGYIVLSEVPTGNTLIGGGIIFSTVLAESLRHVMKRKVS